MTKFKRAVISLLLLLCFASSALALSTREYREMMKDSNFAEADNYLNKIWAELKEKMPRKDFKILEKDRDNWVIKERDDTARALMDKSGYSRIEAYTRATKMRSDYLETILQKYDAVNLKLKSEDEAEKFLFKELSKRGLFKDFHIIMDEETFDIINNEKCWIFRHAVDDPNMIFTLDYYAVSSSGKIYVVDYVEAEYIPFNF